MDPFGTLAFCRIEGPWIRAAGGSPHVPAPSRLDLNNLPAYVSGYIVSTCLMLSIMRGKVDFEANPRTHEEPDEGRPM